MERRDFLRMCAVFGLSPTAVPALPAPSPTPYRRQNIYSKNRPDGSCFICGARLDFYESKLIEYEPPHRFICLWSQTGAAVPSSCVGVMLNHLSGDREEARKKLYDLFGYYTDG